MSSIVEECRQEWRRLKIPEAAADEMAAELAADLDDAAADGISAEEVLGAGAGDPRALATAWATERGLIRPRLRDRVRRRPWVLIATLAAACAAAGFAISETVRGSSARPPVIVPSLIQMSRPAAVRTAHAAGLTVHVLTRSSPEPAGIVISQQPFAGQRVSRGTRITITVARG